MHTLEPKPVYDMTSRMLAKTLLLATITVTPLLAQQPPVAKTNLKVGETAPDFTLLDDQWKPVTLSGFRGKNNVILAFYVLAFTSG